MNTGKIYLIEKNNRRQILADREFDETLICSFLDKSPREQLEYRKKYLLRNKLNKEICENRTWEETPYGYEQRTDYKYSEEEQDLIFTRHEILKRGNEFVTNGTPTSEAHLAKYREQLESLPNIDELTNKYKIRYLSRYNPEWRKRELHKQFTNAEYHLRYRISTEQQALYNYTYYFGDIGKVLLVKWLNRLTDPIASIDELIEEFINDTNIAQEKFEIEQNEKYLKAKECYHGFPSFLLTMLEIHSPRGKSLRHAYNMVKDQNKERLVF